MVKGRRPGLHRSYAPDWARVVAQTVLLLLGALAIGLALGGIMDLGFFAVNSLLRSIVGG